MTRIYAADSAATPAAAWPLLAEPDRWHEWSPHVRGAVGLGEPEVGDRRRGAVMLLGVLPVPARIVAKADGRSWTWRVGPMTMEHAVNPRAGGGSRISVSLNAPGPLEPVLAATYGPVIQLLVTRLARLAASSSTGTSSAG